jgi:hypothetical protein
MKTFFILFAFTLFSYLTQAQELVSTFGTVSKADLESRKSLLDEKAEAEVIFSLAEIELTFYNGLLEVLVRKHERIKIFNEKGLEEANIKIKYLSQNNMELISKMEAQTYNLDNNGNIVVTKLEKKSVYDKKINNKISNQVFTMPEVKAGSIIEYKYLVRQNSPFIRDWYFQKNIPVRYSCVKFNYPEEFLFNPVFHTSIPYTYNTKKNGFRSEQTLMMKDVPAFREEPYLSCEDDYLERVSFNLNGYFSPTVNINLVETWPKIIKQLMADEDFGSQLKKNIPSTKELDDQLKLMSSPVDKMVAIHRFVKKTMTWDGYTSIWATDGVKYAWDKKKGNSGEINLILVNLLKEAGLQAYPVLLSTRDNGKVNTINADLDQFNTVMAYVKIDGKEYFLDGTDKQTPSHLIPKKILYTEGLVISKVDFEKSFSEQDWGWITIWNNKQKYTHRVNLAGEVKADGQITGEAFINSIDYARIADVSDYTASKENFVADHFTKLYSGLKLIDFKTGNMEKDSMPMEQTVKFSMPLNSSGDYQYFTLNLFSGLHENIFLSDSRSTDILFAYNQSYSISGSFGLPEGYEFEELPKNMKMILPDTSIILSRLIQVDNNRLQFRINVDINKPFYTIKEYPVLQEFYKKMYMTLNEQIVIKKARP